MAADPFPGKYFFDRVDARGVWFKVDKEEELFQRYFPFAFVGVLGYFGITTILYEGPDANPHQLYWGLGILALAGVAALVGVRLISRPRLPVWVLVEPGQVVLLDATESVQRRIPHRELAELEVGKYSKTSTDGYGSDTYYTLYVVLRDASRLHLGDYGSEQQRDEYVVHLEPLLPPGLVKREEE
jgi:hypothetical protein